MQRTEWPHFIKLTSEDGNGEFSIEIQKDCSQIRIDLEDDNVYFDTNKKELEIIRDAINDILKCN